MQFKFSAVTPGVWRIDEVATIARRVWMFDSCVFNGRQQLNPKLLHVSHYESDLCTFLWRRPNKFRGKPDPALWLDARNALVNHLTERRHAN